MRKLSIGLLLGASVLSAWALPQSGGFENGSGLAIFGSFTKSPVQCQLTGTYDYLVQFT